MNCLQCGQPLPLLQQFCEQCGAPALPGFNAPAEGEENTPSTWRVSKADVERAQSGAALPKATPTHMMPEGPMLRADATRHMSPCASHPDALAEHSCRSCHRWLCPRCLTGPRCEPCSRRLLMQRAVAWAIDVVVVPLLLLLPRLPWIGLLSVPWLLLRDVGGGMLGKRLLGLRVVDAGSGALCRARQSVVRNMFIPFAPLEAWMARRSPLQQRPLEELAGTVVRGRGE